MVSYIENVKETTFGVLGRSAGSGGGRERGEQSDRVPPNDLADYQLDEETGSGLGSK